MTGPDIRRAGPGDMAALHAALCRLSDDLGDRHVASLAVLAAACAGPEPATYGFLAGDPPLAAALAAPVFSTTRGCAGVAVSDLWVDPAARGTGLGRRMLDHLADFGRDRWAAGFVKLSVYADNDAALGFYRRLGFVEAGRGDRTLLRDTGGPDLRAERRA